MISILIRILPTETIYTSTSSDLASGRNGNFLESKPPIHCFIDSEIDHAMIAICLITDVFEYINRIIYLVRD